MTTLGGRLVLGDRIAPGSVTWEGERIVAVDVDPGGGGPLILPGLVDLHVHGGAGAEFGADAGASRRAAAFHARHGTTTTLASLASAPLDATVAGLHALAGLVAEGVLAGVHLEGPYLDDAHRGAQDRAALRAPDLAELEVMLAAGRGTVRVMTLAPELPGALEIVERLEAAGVVAALGHTGAGFAQVRAAVDRGATLATHLFNGMRPLHHRAGGPVAAALLDERVCCELIADGHHVGAEVLELCFRVLGPARVALITDAIAAAGCDDGAFRLGRVPVRVVGGIARLDEPGAASPSLAGSTLTMDAAVRHCVGIGIPLGAAVTAASLTPARAIGIEDRCGSLEAGKQADLVVTDDGLHVTGVLRRGRWLDPLARA